LAGDRGEITRSRCSRVSKGAHFVFTRGLMRKRASRIDRVANRLDALPRPIGLRWSFLADRGVSVFTRFPTHRGTRNVYLPAFG